MRPTPETMVNWAAGAVMAGALIWAGALVFTTPNDTGPDVGAIQAMAARLESRNGPMLNDRNPGRRRDALPDEPSFVKERIDYAALRRARRGSTAPAAFHPQPRPSAASRGEGPTTTAGNESAVENLALLGVTSADGKEVAWLANIDSEQRENGSVGEMVFGFRVTAIAGEAVTLTRGSRDYTLRLGDQVLNANADTPESVSQANVEEVRRPNAEERRDRSTRGGDRGRLAGSFFLPGGRSSREDDHEDERERPASYSPTEDRRDGGEDRSPRVFPLASGLFNPALTGLGSFNSGTQTGPASSPASTSGSPTINPRTARRRGTVSGTSGGSTPAPITNPQTQRRRGTVSQPAFGESDNRVRNQPASPTQSR